MIIDTDKLTLDGKPLYTKESFEELTQLWLKVGWQLKVPYSYSWMGVPILQIPDDMVRMQEVIFRLQPEVIIETGVAHGGSLVFYASLCKALGHGKVIGIEKGLRCRKTIESHPLAEYIMLIEGDSTSSSIVERIHKLCHKQTALVILDSDHSKAHVAKELEAYHDLIQSGFYIVATDGNMKDLADVPRGKKEWEWNNPQEAAKEFALRHTDFSIEQPHWVFNESNLDSNITYWPSAWLRRH